MAAWYGTQVWSQLRVPATFRGARSALAGVLAPVLLRAYPYRMIG
jgi:hypothetical protein